MEEESYDDVYSEEFKEQAKNIKIKSIQLEFISLACKSFQERNKCNSECIYLSFNLCNKIK